jgi:integrase/recombinase XerC
MNPNTIATRTPADPPPTLRPIGKVPTTPSQFVEVVVASLLEAAELTPGSLEEIPQKMRLFALFCERGLGVEEFNLITADHARAFVASAKADGTRPAVAWMHVRRGAVRLLFKEARRMGLTTIDPTLDIALAPRSVLSTRPLTDDEVELCRAYAIDSLSDLRRPICWALAEATGRTAEIHRVRLGDIDMDGRRVYLHGDPRAVPRWAPLTEWGAAQVGRGVRAAGRRPDRERRLVPLSDGATAPRASVSTAVIRTLKAAGLHDEPDVRPRSVVAWAGAHVMAGGARIEDAALLMGCRTLDQTAAMVGFDWRSSGGTPGLWTPSRPTLPTVPA